MTGVARRATGRRRPVPRRLVIGLALVAYAWWAAGLPHFTLAALVATVGVPALVVLAAAWRRRPARQESRWAPGAWRPWAAVLGALAGWELLAYSLSPRSAHPTLSSLADAALRPRAVEAAAFLAWLGLGWRLARR